MFLVDTYNLLDNRFKSQAFSSIFPLDIYCLVIYYRFHRIPRLLYKQYSRQPLLLLENSCKYLLDMEFTMTPQLHSNDLVDIFYQSFHQMDYF